MLLDAKKRLERIRELDKKIESKLKERDRLARYTNGFVLKEDLEMRLRRYDEEVNDYIDELLNLEIDVVEDIEQLDNFNHQMVLRERYIHNKKWEDIEEEQHYDISYLHNLHRKALKEMDEVLMSKN